MTDKQIFNKYLKIHWPNVKTKKDKEIIYNCIGFKKYISAIRLQESIDIIKKEFHPIVKVMYKIIMIVPKIIDKLLINKE